METIKRRNPVVAAVLSLITPGLGHVYNGNLKKGIVYLFALVIVGIISSLLMRSSSGLFLSLVIVLGFFFFILFDAASSAGKLREIQLKPYNRWYIYVIIFLFSGFGLSPMMSWTIKNNIVKAYKIPSGSMEPTLLVGDHFICDKLIYKMKEPARGDVIVFEYAKDPSKEFVKRVIAIGGEKIEIIKEKIYINDKLIEDPWGCFTKDRELKKPAPAWERLGPYYVPKGSVFVMGDNRDKSQDSRHYGYVEFGKIKGKALYIYFANHLNRIGKEIK